MPKLVFGPDNRDAYTLRRIAELGLALAFECRNCRKISQKDVLDLIGDYGPSATIGQLRPKAKCSRCKKRVAEVLLKSPGIRGEGAWWPRPPLATR